MLTALLSLQVHGAQCAELWAQRTEPLVIHIVGAEYPGEEGVSKSGIEQRNYTDVWFLLLFFLPVASFRLELLFVGPHVTQEPQITLSRFGRTMQVSCCLLSLQHRSVTGTRRWCNNHSHHESLNLNDHPTPARHDDAWLHPQVSTHRGLYHLMPVPPIPSTGPDLCLCQNAGIVSHPEWSSTLRLLKARRLLVCVTMYDVSEYDR